MDILLNERSLSGQYASREFFVDEILPSLIEVLREIEDFGEVSPYKIYKKIDFYNYLITKTDTLHSILIGNLSRQYPSIRKFKNQLIHFVQEPYWEDTRRHLENCSYTYNGENFCNHSVAEACERDKIILSLKESQQFTEKTLTILKNTTKEIILDNLFEKGQYSKVLRTRGIACRFSLKDKSRFQKDGRIVQGQNVYKELDTSYYWYLDNLHKNHYEVFDKNEQHLGIANMDGDIDHTKKENGRTLQ